MSIQLDREQLKAAEDLEHSIFLTAGAGAGKTKVLTERVKNILSKTDGRVLAITFTNRAAEEMASRIESAVSQIEPGRMKVSTIDGFCRYLLKIYGVEAHTQEAMRQLEEGEAKALLEKAFEAAAPKIYENDIVLDLLKETETKADSFKRQLMDSYDQYRTRGVLEDFAPREMGDDTIFEDFFDLLNDLKTCLTSGSSKIRKTLNDPYFLEVQKEDLRAQQAYLERLGGIGNIKNISDADKATYKRLQERLLCLKESENAPYIEGINACFDLLHDAYVQIKKDLGVVDFQDLLEKATALLESDTIYFKPYDHILVDEFQDTNPLQIRFLRALQKNSTLFVVGDKKQSIYAFRGAETEVSHDFKNAMCEGGAQSMALVNNYRSHAALVERIGQLFKDRLEDYGEISGHGTGNWDFKGIDLSEGGEVDIEDAIRKEALWIVEDIQQRPSTSRALLLWRKRYMSIYESVFREYGIRYRNVASDGFFETREIRDLIIALEAKITGKDTYAFLRSPFVGWDQETMFLYKAGEILKDAELKPLREMRAFFKNEGNTTSAYVFLKRLIQKTGYVDYVFKRKGEQGVANIDALLEMAARYDASFYHLEGFFDWAEKKRKREKCAEAAYGGVADIEIATMHASKGLEFETVYLGHLFAKERGAGGLWNYTRGQGVGLNRPEYDAIWSRNKEIIADKNEQEALRLLYVAMTRAEKYLYLLKSTEKEAGLLCHLTELQFEPSTPSPLAPKNRKEQRIYREEKAPMLLKKKPIVSASGLLRSIKPREIAQEVKSKSGSYLEFGNLFHAYAQRAKAPDVKVRDMILQRAKTLGVDMDRLKDAIDFYDGCFHIGEIIGTEVAFSAPFEDVILEGFYDQLREIDGDIAIIDFKTGMRGAQTNAMTSYRLQMGLYGKAYERIKGHSAKLYLLTTADKQWTEVILSEAEERQIDDLLKAYKN